MNTHHPPSTYANISGATIDASDSMTCFGVSMPSFPQVIFPTPKTTFLGRADSLGGSALVLQLDPADANVASLDITVKRKGTNDAQRVSVPISQ